MSTELRRPEKRAAARARVVQVDMSETMYVKIPAEEAEQVFDPNTDYLDNAERITEWRRIANYAPHHIDAGFSVSEAEDYDYERWGYPDVVDGVDGRPSYLWSAREFVGKARYELSCGRYREGHCPELDEVNTLLGRLEERLRLMALAVDGIPA